jgi:hypothetical protein
MRYYAPVTPQLCLCHIAIIWNHDDAVCVRLFRLIGKELNEAPGLRQYNLPSCLMDAGSKSYGMIR